jgi:uncharacterized protein (TIGR02246 family)
MPIGSPISLPCEMPSIGTPPSSACACTAFDFTAGRRTFDSASYASHLSALIREVPMNGRMALSFGVSLLALLAACTPPADTASTDSTTIGSAAGTLATPTIAEVRTTIEAANQRFMIAIKAGDIPAMSANFADDAVALMPGMPAMNGLAAIEEGWKGMFASMTLNDMRFATDDIMLSDDVAVEHGTYNMTSTLKGAKPKTETGKYLTVWRRQADGSWRIVRDMSAPDSAP